MGKRTFKKYADLAKYRVSMKRQLRDAGVEVDNDAATEELEEMMPVAVPTAQPFSGVVERAKKAMSPEEL